MEREFGLSQQQLERRVAELTAERDILKARVAMLEKIAGGLEGRARQAGASLRVRLRFERRDAWVGVYWRTERTTRGRLLTFYVCLLPFLPIIVQIRQEDEG